jgi:hypothetical protein
MARSYQQNRYHWGTGHARDVYPELLHLLGCHFDQREKSRVSKYKISRYRSKLTRKKPFRSIPDNRVETNNLFILQKALPVDA